MAPPSPGSPIIHIGYHRTASTWFQEQFYPKVANGTYIPRMAVRDAIIAPTAFAFSPGAARQDIMHLAQGKTPLLYEENLSGYLHNGGLGGLLSKEVANRPHATFPDARIVVILRRQPDIVAAAYAQYVKGGGTHSPARYVLAQNKVKGAAQHWYKAPLFSLEHFEYGPLLAHYASLFGRAALTVGLYEEFADGQRRFLGAFADKLGLDVSLDDLDTRPVNASITRRQLRILRRLNLLTSRSVIDKRSFRDVEGWYQHRWNWVRRLDDALPQTRKRRNILSARLVRLIEDRFRQSNAALAAEWQLPLHRYGYPLPNG